jgi:ribosomal RNA-processing protein 17
LQIREERAAEYQRIFEETRKRMADMNSSTESGPEGDSGEEEEWVGFEEPAPVDYEAEYIDEDKYTTVTVEDMDPSKEALYKAETGGSDDESRDPDEKKAEAVPGSGPTSAQGKRPQNADKAKKKRKKFRYESKAERVVTQRKERLGNRKKATTRRER